MKTKLLHPLILAMKSFIHSPVKTKVKNYHKGKGEIHFDFISYGCTTTTSGTPYKKNHQNKESKCAP